MLLSRQLEITFRQTDRQTDRLKGEFALFVWCTRSVWIGMALDVCNSCVPNPQAFDSDTKKSAPPGMVVSSFECYILTTVTTLAMVMSAHIPKLDFCIGGVRTTSVVDWFRRRVSSIPPFISVELRPGEARLISARIGTVSTVTAGCPFLDFLSECCQHTPITDQHLDGLSCLSPQCSGGDHVTPAFGQIRGSVSLKSLFIVLKQRPAEAHLVSPGIVSVSAVCPFLDFLPECYRHTPITDQQLSGLSCLSPQCSGGEHVTPAFGQIRGSGSLESLFIMPKLRSVEAQLVCPGAWSVYEATVHDLQVRCDMSGLSLVSMEHGIMFRPLLVFLSECCQCSNIHHKYAVTSITARCSDIEGSLATHVSHAAPSQLDTTKESGCCSQSSPQCSRGERATPVMSQHARMVSLSSLLTGLDLRPGEARLISARIGTASTVTAGCPFLVFLPECYQHTPITEQHLDGLSCLSPQCSGGDHVTPAFGQIREVSLSNHCSSR